MQKTAMRKPPTSIAYYATAPARGGTIFLQDCAYRPAGKARPVHEGVCQPLPPGTVFAAPVVSSQHSGRWIINAARHAAPGQDQYEFDMQDPALPPSPAEVMRMVRQVERHLGRGCLTIAIPQSAVVESRSCYTDL